MKEVVEVVEGREKDFSKKYFKYVDDVDFYEYKGVQIPFETLKSIVCCKGMSNVEHSRVFDIAKTLAEKEIPTSKFLAKKIAKLEHLGKFDKFVNNYKRYGVLYKEFKKNGKNEEEIQEEIENIFRTSNRDNGVVPKITDVMAEISACMGVEPYEIWEKFSVKKVRELLAAGFSKAETVVAYTSFNDKQLQAAKDNRLLAEIALTLVAKDGGENGQFKKAAMFVLDHPNTNSKTLLKIAKNAEDVDFSNNLDEIVSSMKSSNKKGIDGEVKKLEKAYKKTGFKVKNCVCELKNVVVRQGKYEARILDGNDPRQVVLGMEKYGGKECCQQLGEAGETSMVYGLTNKKAGFFEIRDEKTKGTKLMGLCWEANENTLVFDNLEIQNDADISIYKDVLGEWLEKSPYENIAMGNGYNNLKYKANFRTAPNFTPSVTPYDIYVMSYEKNAEPEFLDGHDATDEEIDRLLEIPSEEKARKMLETGEVSYYQYLYSDVDDGKGLSWLKENGELDRFFSGSEIEGQQEFDFDDLCEEEDYEEDYEE